MLAGNQILAKNGAEFTSRILTDDMTGRSDRVVVEWEMESAVDMNAALVRASMKLAFIHLGKNLLIDITPVLKIKNPCMWMIPMQTISRSPNREPASTLSTTFNWCGAV